MSVTVAIANLRYCLARFSSYFAEEFMDESKPYSPDGILVCRQNLDGAADCRSSMILSLMFPGRG